MTKLTYIKDKKYFNYRTLYLILGMSAIMFSSQLFFTQVQSLSFTILASAFTIFLIGLLLVRRKMSSYTQNLLTLSNEGLRVLHEDQVIETFEFDSEKIKYMKIKLSPESLWMSEKQFIELHTNEGVKSYYFQSTSQYNFQKLMDLIPKWKNNGIQVHQL